MKNRTHGERLNKMELFGLKKNVKKLIWESLNKDKISIGKD